MRVIRIFVFALLAVLALSIAILFDFGPSNKRSQAQGFSHSHINDQSDNPATNR
ncbi:MAG TPA: hypothetical protein VFC63_01255 [Blastocatellia bacterium]|nr:hypothetical protein [Blastocatellia bacterium]